MSRLYDIQDEKAMDTCTVMICTGVPSRPGHLYRHVKLKNLLGVSGCRLGYFVRYVRTYRFLNSLTQARQDGSYLNFLHSLNKTDVLILDDWMRDPIPLTAAQDLLEVFDDRFGKTATLIASQVPVADWHSRFPDPTLADAILDRTIHNAYCLSLLGDSQRKLRGSQSMSPT